MIPYGKQNVDEEDIAAVISALRSDWLTTGPLVDEFERRVCEFTGAKEGAALCNGTAALHASMHALGVGKGDEVIVTPMTFAASANCILYVGARPVFCDIEPDTLLIDVESIKKKISKKTKAIVGVDYAGHPCDWDAINDLAEDHDLRTVADSCHSLGGKYKGRSVGTLADLSVLSFHPVKHITTGEGGMVLGQDPILIKSIRSFRNHGIDRDHRQRSEKATWKYDMVDLGYNYRLTDIQCALGISQLRKLPKWLERRQEIAARYNRLLKGADHVVPLSVRPWARHAYHLYVVKVTGGKGRDLLFNAMRKAGVGVNVHYIPVHLHHYYVKNQGTNVGQCPNAELAYSQILSLPMYPGLKDEEIDFVVDTLVSNLV